MPSLKLRFFRFFLLLVMLIINNTLFWKRFLKDQLKYCAVKHLMRQNDSLTYRRARFCIDWVCRKLSIKKMLKIGQNRVHIQHDWRREPLQRFIWLLFPECLCDKYCTATMFSFGSKSMSPSAVKTMAYSYSLTCLCIVLWRKGNMLSFRTSKRALKLKLISYYKIMDPSNVFIKISFLCLVPVFKEKYKAPFNSSGNLTWHSYCTKTHCHWKHILRTLHPVESLLCEELWSL